MHVTQGSLRSDPSELIIPTLQGLTDLDALVIVTSGAADEAVIAAALGGKFLALPCEARYVLSGSLDTSGAIESKATAGSGAVAGGSAGR